MQVNCDMVICQVQDFLKSIYEMIMVGLIGMMIIGIVGQCEVFFDQIKQLLIIKDLWVVCSEVVSKLYGFDIKDMKFLEVFE